MVDRGFPPVRWRFRRNTAGTVTRRDTGRGSANKMPVCVYRTPPEERGENTGFPLLGEYGTTCCAEIRDHHFTVGARNKNTPISFAFKPSEQDGTIPGRARTLRIAGERVTITQHASQFRGIFFGGAQRKAAREAGSAPKEENITIQKRNFLPRRKIVPLPQGKYVPVYSGI